MVKWSSGSPSSGLLQKWASRKRWKKMCTWATPIRNAPYTSVRKFGLKWLLWKLGFQGLLVSKDFKVACCNVAILSSFRQLLNHAQGIRREGGTQVEGEEIQGTLPLYHILSWLYKSRGRLNCTASTIKGNTYWCTPINTDYPTTPSVHVYMYIHYTPQFAAPLHVCSPCKQILCDPLILLVGHTCTFFCTCTCRWKFTLKLGHSYAHVIPTVESDLGSCGSLCAYTCTCTIECE